jgi:hypothetical protein
MNDKLSAKDVNKLINKEVINIDIPSIHLFGKNVSLDSIKITILSIILWTVIFYFFGLFKINKYSIIFFIIYILIELFNLFNDPIKIHTNVELTTFINQGQLERTQTLFAILILLIIFLFNFKSDNEYKGQIYKIYLIILFLLFLSFFRYDMKSIFRNVKNVTQFSNQTYNQCIILFIYVLYLIFIVISKETPK